jgi:hypothetical protein
VAAYLAGDAANLKTIIVYGGTAAVTDTVANAAQAAG